MYKESFKCFAPSNTYLKTIEKFDLTNSLEVRLVHVPISRKPECMDNGYADGYISICIYIILHIMMLRDAN